ncbi:hypothetical protein TNCT_536581 [Trichonephila clavata]|uniref:Uncharacterized protein n=1 Tax=Trichonephila clavata TaxID=2740835 RepID=A0A8X6FXK8_TRICU|nr:hypothetical protein TNCT_536581 [Trichonephila clavata]
MDKLSGNSKPSSTVGSKDDTRGLRTKLRFSFSSSTPCPKPCWVFKRFPESKWSSLKRERPSDSRIIFHI